MPYVASGGANIYWTEVGAGPPILLIMGVGGSMLWWVTLVLLVNRFRDRFDERAMRTMNHIAGLAIGGFGVVTFLIGIRHGR